MPTGAFAVPGRGFAEPDRRPAATAVRWKNAHYGRYRRGRQEHVVLMGRADGPTVMLANGFGCDQNMWRLVAPGLAGDFRVVLFDHVGSGRSDLSAWQPERYASLDGYADDLLRICRELGLR